jgi:hypothetical protein
MHYFRKLTAIVSEMTLLVQPPEPAPPPLDDDDDGSDEGGGGGGDPMLVDVGVSQAGGVVPSQQGVGPGDEEDTVRGREDAALAALTPPFLTPGEVIRAGLALPDLVSKSTNRRASEAGLYKLNPVYPFLTPGEVIRAGLALPDLVSKSTNRRASEAGLYKLNPVYP